MALSLAVGFVVDDAIVMLENIVRHMEMGKSARQASFDGSKEIGFTIMSMTISLVAVFIPVLLLPGIVGKLFNEFAVTISIAILISGFISLTFTPMLCSRFLRPTKEHGQGLASLADRIFEKFLGMYKWSLELALDNKLLVVGIFILMLIATGAVFSIMPKGFMPTEDQGQIIAMTEGEQGISYDAMVEHHDELVKIIMADPNVESVMSSIGVGNGQSESDA